MDFGIINNYREQIMEDLGKLVAIRSVAEKPCEGYPCGREAARALHFILDRARELGFETVCHNNVSGHAQYGEGEGYAAVLTHVDVVPEGEGWNTDPFTLTFSDGRMFGRGVADDKGAAVIALYCMKALKDAGVKGRRALRCVFGCGEEIGMEDMDSYFAAEPLPEMGFTPDSDYPVCNREKGIMRITVELKNGCAIKSFTAGSAVNCVAEKSVMTVECDDNAALAVKDYAVKYGCETACESNGKLYAFTAKGKSAHAMCPQNGVNSASALLLAAREVLGKASGFAVKACRLICEDYSGSGLSAACEDEQSGKLTANLGLVKADEGSAKLSIDIRYPVTVDGEELFKKIKAAVEAEGGSVSLDENMAPLYLPDDHPFIQMLSGCYEQVTGEKGGTYSTGGGTYARSLGGRGVAFGMAFPDSQPTHLHEANESFDEKEYMKHAEICLAAMYNMLVME